MLILFSYILKILFSVAAVCFILYFIMSDKKVITLNYSKDIILVTVVISSLINLMYGFSMNINNYTIYTVCFLLIAIFLFVSLMSKPMDLIIISALCYFCIISISIGYILYTIIVLALYYIINNNYHLLMNVNIENDDHDAIDLEKDE